MNADQAKKIHLEAQRLFQQQKYSDALAQLDNLEQHFPNDQNVMYARARCLVSLGRLDEARLEAGENLYYATWSPDGRTIVTTTSKGTARLWRAADWTAFRDPVTTEENFEAQLERSRAFQP